MLRVAVANSCRCVSKTMVSIGQRAQVLLPGVSCDWACVYNCLTRITKQLFILHHTVAICVYDTKVSVWKVWHDSLAAGRSLSKLNIDFSWLLSNLEGNIKWVQDQMDHPLKQCDFPCQWRVCITYPSIKLTFLCPSNDFPENGSNSYPLLERVLHIASCFLFRWIYSMPSGASVRGLLEGIVNNTGKLASDSLSLWIARGWYLYKYFSTIQDTSLDIH